MIRAERYCILMVIQLFLHRIFYSFHQNQKEIHSLTAFIHLAPKPTSPDVLKVSTNDASTAPRSLPDNEAVQNTDLLHTLNNEVASTSDSAGISSGVEPESSGLDPLGNLTVSASTTSVKLVWSAPDEVFDSFLVELTAPSAATQPRVTTVPGTVRKAEIEGLSPATRYDITLQGLVEGDRSLPLRVFATTGTWSKYFFL